MVSTRSARKKQEESCKVETHEREYSTMSREQKTSKKSASSKSSIVKQKRLLELKAEEEKAFIQMTLIDKKLAVELAELEEAGSSRASLSEELKEKEHVVEKWLESSHQELSSQRADGGVGPQLPAGEPALEPARPPPPAPPCGGTNDTVHALASALKDLAALSAIKVCDGNDKLLTRMCTPRDLPSYSGDPLQWLEFKRAYEESSQVCNFSDRENLWRLRRSLHGPAKDAVTALFIGATSPAEVISTLELQFGNPDIIISRILQDLYKLRQLPQDYQKEIIPFSIKVKNCVAAVTAIGCESHLQGTNVVSVILSKLPSFLISKWTDYSYPIINQDIKPKLVILSEFLSEEAIKITKTFVSVQSYNRPTYSGYSYNDNRNKARTLLVNNELSDTSVVMNVNKNNNCGYCRGALHSLPECKKFKKSLRKDRWAYVKRHGMCYKCLKPRHKQNTCPEPACDIDECGLPHHRLLHYTTNVNKSNNDNVNITEVIETDSRSETVTHLNVNSCKVLLKTVPIYLHGPSGIVRSVALLDDGSTITLISDKLAAQLGLRGIKQSMRVCGAWDNSEIVCDGEIMDLDISNKHGTKYSIRARCVKNMNLPVQNVSTADLSNYELMKPEIKDIISDKQCKPELLIGQDNYELLLPLEVVGGDASEPYFTRTPLGWCIHGCLRSLHHVGAMSESTLFLHKDDMYTNIESQRILHDMQEEMRLSFAIESMGVSAKPRQNIEDVQACEILERTAKLVDGRWYVGLPWKQNSCELPDCYHNAAARLKGVEKKMKANPGYAARYRERVEHLFSNSYASLYEQTQQSHSPKRIWYLPHFGVDNPNKQKLRLVFDAACSSAGTCLNDYILKGPDLLTSLYGILLRFRENKIALTADIKDMFLRIKIFEEDRNALRFLWRQSPERPMTTYAMSSLIFGANCSPFVAQFIKNKNAERHESSMPEAARAIYTQHYMDDYIDSVEDEQTASKLVNDVTYIHQQGGFEIRNWMSNDKAVLFNLPNQPSQSTISLKNGQQYDGERTLGLIWNPTYDTIGFDVSFKRIPTPIMNGKRKPTKREMLRVLMSIFDVYGFLSPITIKGKIMLQDIWRSGISWDDEIPDAIFTKWLHWLSIVKNISTIQLPRHYKSAVRGTERPVHTTVTRCTYDAVANALNNKSPPTVVCSMNLPTSPARTARYTHLEIHIFCDSSAKAMCAVGYWRWIDELNKQIQVAFISSKCRVAPVKYISMPRLELQAALMAARLLANIINEHRIKPTKKYLWCDSTTVLQWIRNDARNYKAYIAHRLGEIDELTNVNDWKYIPTKLNIADVATRDSCNIDTLRGEWLHGPNFLCEDERLWPKESDAQRLDVRGADLECINTLHFTPDYLPAVPDPERFSSWLRLLRSTYVVLSFIDKIKKVTSDTDRTLMERAELLLLKYSQMKSFPDDLRRLKQKEKLDRKSKLLTLSPMLDDDEILRLEGRIDAAPGVSNDVKRPIILDGRCHVARLIVSHYHKKACHGNQEMVVNEIKQRYWILRLRPTVKYISSQCMVCRIRRAQPQPPRMGALPAARMSHHQRVFTFTGVDLFGPMEVTIGRRRERRYGVIFTCLTVRAVHIEMVNDLTTDALIMALRRMAARRGWPRYLYSDNGTNLRGADAELKSCVRELDETKLKDEVMTYSTATTWIFIPPASPHWGGAWERLIRCIKTALKAILKERAPRDDTLRTLLAEVEHIINSRPLTHVTVEPNSDESLTPNHFLLGASSGSPTLGVYSSTDAFLRKQWRISQVLADMFWKRWVREVLPDMRPRTKWHEERRPLQVGDLVLVVDPNSPRNVWLRGRIQAVLPGKDGQVRVVELRTKSGMLRRPASRVARIAIGSECCASTGEGSVGDA